MCSSAGVKMAREEEASDSVTEIQVPRRREPEHFLLKVESFSKSNLEKYESDEFEGAGYKWRLILYPNGDKERNGSNHISLYLSITDTQNLPSGWEVEADFSLFVYNSLSQKYLTCKLADITRFNWLKTESGFAQLIPLEEFKETSNGYLFGDTCVFGAEVYVTGSSVIAKRQTLSMTKDTGADTGTRADCGAGAGADSGAGAGADSGAGADPNADVYIGGGGDGDDDGSDGDGDGDGEDDDDDYTVSNIFTWTVRNFSTLNDKLMHSEEFIIEDVPWKLRLYPTETGDGKGKSISVYLAKLTKLAEIQKVVKAEFKLRIKNQLNTNHVEKQVAHIFCDPLGTSSGFFDFMPLSDVNDKSKGFLKKDCLVVEVEITKVEINQHSIMKL